MASTPIRLVVLLAVSTLWPALSEPEAAGTTAGTTADAVRTAPGAPPQEQAADGVEAPEAPSAAAARDEAANGEAASAAVATAMAQARLDLAAAVNASAEASSHLRGSTGWRHGIPGETCCMCSMHVGFNTVLYAAADYSHFFTGHAADWQCQRECEMKCHIRGGHYFGCYDEQHLLAMDRLYGHRSGYQILHDVNFGGIC